MNTAIINKVAHLLNQMDGITPEAIQSAQLMRRRDTKYVLPLALLPELLEAVKADYYAMYVNDIRMMPYHTVYYDTPGYEMYLAHHNQRLNRYKIRRRTYETNQLSFLEVKHKNNKGVTNKKRIAQDGKGEVYNAQFVAENSPYDYKNIKPVLENRFLRIMLVNKHMAERVTIDLQLQFSRYKGAVQKQVPHLVIVEVKRDLDGPSTPMMAALQEKRIKALGFSKYCIGTALLNSQVRVNLFKQKIRLLSKIEPNMQM